MVRTTTRAKHLKLRSVLGVISTLTRVWYAAHAQHFIALMSLSFENEHAYLGIFNNFGVAWCVVCMFVGEHARPLLAVAAILHSAHD